MSPETTPAGVKLSVVVPVYNERYLVEELVRRVLAVSAPEIREMEVLLIDDGSKDGSLEILRRLAAEYPDRLRLLEQGKNQGKGAAIRRGITEASGDLILFQDADLEYDPQDYTALIAPLRSGQADVVYGSRFKGSIDGMRWLNRIGNHTMSAASRLLYGVQVSDLMTGYKMYRTSLTKGLHIRANGFDFEAEFTARLAQRGARFAEVPISFHGRTFEEGKKIRAFDAVRVMRELIRCKVSGEARA